MPYPVDANTASAVQTAIKHHVTTWWESECQILIEGWLYDHFVTRELFKLPDQFLARCHGTCDEIEEDGIEGGS